MKLCWLSPAAKQREYRFEPSSAEKHGLAFGPVSSGGTLMISPKDAAAEVLRRRFGRQSLAEFAQAIDVPGKPASEDADEWLFNPVESIAAAHHILLMDTLDRVLDGEIKNLMVFMPPGSAKSTYASVVFPAYAMGKKPGTRIILSSYASAIAWKQSRRTRQIVKSAKYQPLFGTALVAGNQSVEEWALDNGSEYMAGGLLSGMTGNRAGGVIVDDPVAGREDAESETIRRKTRDAYEDDLKTRLVPGGWSIIIQTRWHEDDLSGGILPEGWSGQSGFVKGRDGQNWFVLCLPAICDREDDPLGRKIGQPLWPEWFKGDHFDKFRSNARTWSALFQQKPRPLEGAELQLKWVQRYRNPPTGTNNIILVDPSSGRKKDAGDYSCMWVVGLASDQNAYVMDCIRDRLNLSGRTEALFELHRKWKPIEVRYEQYGLQADIEAIRNEQERQQYRFKITEVGGQVKKEDRIRRLIPWFEHAKLWLPDRITYDGRDLVKEFLEREYAAFPVSRTDDMLDALARLAEPELKLPFPQPPKRKAANTWIPKDPGMAY
jgi:phage terminase large subunit-like protein